MLTEAAGARYAPELRALRLRAPRLTPDQVRRTTVGLRPFRAAGFAVERETIGRTTVIHHYGHGGCGLSLSWGTAELVLAHAFATPHRRAAVLGAGAVGLATACLLLERGIAVTVYARAFDPAETTTGAAGAFWAPFTLAAPEGRTPELVARLAGAARIAHRRFAGMVGERYGVRRLPLFLVGNEPPALSWEMAAAPELFAGPVLAPGEHPFGERYARRADGMTIEPAPYLSALLDDVRRAGGTLVDATLTSPEDVARLPEPLVVNCTGLGARALFGDEALVPVRGQLTLLAPQPGVDYMLVAPADSLYMLPRRDGLILGTSHGHGDWSLAPDRAEETRLLAAFAEWFASTTCAPSCGTPPW